MRLLDFLLAAPLALAAPLLEAKANIIQGKWIVVMKDDYEMDAAARRKRGIKVELDVESLVAPQHTYNIGKFKGYAMDASDDLINRVAKLEDVSSSQLQWNKKHRSL